MHDIYGRHFYFYDGREVQDIESDSNPDQSRTILSLVKSEGGESEFKADVGNVVKLKGQEVAI